MRYCLSFDVAKGKSMVGLFDEKGESIIKPYEVKHTRTSLLKLHEAVQSLKLDNLAVIMESTSIYHYPVLKFFKNLNYMIIVLNPIISREHKKNLRKTKTDKTDCVNLAEIYFKDEYNEQSAISDDYLELQHISRQIYNLNESNVRFKNRFRQLIEMVFPEYELIFKKDALFSETALSFICKFPHADLVANKRIDALANALGEVHHRHPNYYRRKAEIIKEMAFNSLTTVDKDSYVIQEVIQQATLILNLQNEIDILKCKLIELAKTIDIFENIVSIYGVGEYTAALFLAEIKDPRRFKNIKKLTAACGLDPTIIQSGKSINYNGPISKRGNKVARKVLFNMVINIICSASKRKEQLNNPILSYYIKKRSEGKHHYACVIACTTKLLRIAYTLCINNTKYSI